MSTGGVLANNLTMILLVLVTLINKFESTLVSCHNVGRCFPLQLSLCSRWLLIPLMVCIYGIRLMLKYMKLHW